MKAEIHLFKSAKLSEFIISKLIYLIAVEGKKEFLV